MSTWHSKDVGDGVQSFVPSQKLHEAFVALAKGGGILPGAGVFSRYDLQANVVTWYFSPQATSLARSFGASPCEKPTPTKGFGLLVGDACGWEIHFPGYLDNKRSLIS